MVATFKFEIESNLSCNNPIVRLRYHWVQLIIMTWCFETSMNEDFVIGIRFSWSVTLLFFWHDRIVCEDQKYALLFCHICDYLAPELSHNYRLMHALFQIKTVIIPRDRYRPEGWYRSRDDNSPDSVWKKACINLFITYFNIELKKTKLTSHTETKLMDMSDRYRLRVLLRVSPTNLSSLDVDIFQTTINSWAEVMSWVSHERLDIVLSELCLTRIIQSLYYAPAGR